MEEESSKIFEAKEMKFGTERQRAPSLKGIVQQLLPTVPSHQQLSRDLMVQAHPGTLCILQAASSFAGGQVLHLL